MSKISKAIVAGVAALSLSAAVVATASPAAAQWRGPAGGWHGGGPGWHGGGWGGPGWRPGPRPGWNWHQGYWNGGAWNNGWWVPAVAAGVATGAIIATAPGWGGGGACWQNRPVYDMNGVWLGNRTVNVCQ